MPQAIFQQRLQQFQAQTQQAQARYNLVAGLRLVVFLATAIGVGWLGWQTTWGTAGLVLLVGLSAFIGLMRWHQQVLYRRNHLRFLAAINQTELDRLQNNWASLPDGAAFVDAKHPYTSDLDIFGRRSLYQWLNRSTSPFGAQTLAAWLQAPATTEAISARQEALSALREAVDLRQEAEARGKHASADMEAVAALNEWLNTPSVWLNSSFWRVVPWLMGLLSVACLIATLWWGYYPLLLPVAINFSLLLPQFKKITTLYEQIDPSVDALREYAQVFACIEAAEVDVPLVRQYQASLGKGTGAASIQIKRLAYAAYLLSQRNNPWFTILANGLFLWDIHSVRRLERWKEANRSQVAQWWQVMGEWEALTSLAGAWYANPTWTLPTIDTETDFVWEAKALAHPLIPDSQRINNDMRLQGIGHTMLITGANMSGKTTFQRTVGINTVLALCGAPVLASQMRLSVCQVFSSMRTQDSLEENISSFYAELKRLRQLIDHLQAQPQLPVLYLLDEILKGTNSQDRHQGARGLILQLHQLRASGIVSTHDLVLSEMETTHSFIHNYSFNSQIVGDEILFDYRLTPGACKSFNAVQLMRKMGIAVANEAPQD
jgi:hypothetical protein